MHSAPAAPAAGPLELLAPLLPEDPMLRVEGEGAEQVYCDLSLTGTGMLLQFVNYNAQLHPDLPELEQAEADRTIRAEDLRVRFRPPDGRSITGLTLLVPGDPPSDLAQTGGGFILPRLGAYAAVLVDLGPGA